MPADSEAQTWRPLGVRLAAGVFGGALLVICSVAWWGLGPEIRAKMVPAEQATILGLGVIIFGGLYALARSRVSIAGDRLTVVNGLRTRHLTRQQVVSVTLPSGAPWATLDLVDGTAISAMGIQGSDGDRARTAVRELRAAIDAG